MDTALQQLFGRARGSLGPAVAIEFDGVDGPLIELQELLSQMNGFFAFDAGLQVFPAGESYAAPELLFWNDAETWKDTYAHLADDLFCFAQDVLGTQFAIRDGRDVVTFDPETATVSVIGQTLEAWAQWLFEDPDVHATAGFAWAWQKENGALAPDERLLPRQLIALGGSFEFDNLMVSKAVESMRIRGPIAQQLHDLPDGATIRITTPD